MKERSFIDTNILVYTDDADSPEKSRLAVDLVENAMRTNLGVVSTQVLQEYFVAATRKLNVDIAVAKRRTQFFWRMHVILVTPEDVISAINPVQLHNLSFWDSLITLRKPIFGPLARSFGCHYGLGMFKAEFS